MTANPQDAWSLYWAGGSLDSCLPAGTNDGDANPVRQLWSDLASSLAPGSRVLDLATGNGTVPVTLLRANPALEVTGVDQAEIDPLGAVSDVPELKQVSFQGRVDVADLPFPAASFDVVTSQYGVEYGALEEAVGEALSVLRAGGQLMFLMHHVDSEVVAPATPLREEIASLLDPKGPLPLLIKYVAGQIPVDKLEAAGERHLKANVRRTARITGQVYKMVNAIVERLAESAEQARVMSGVLAARLEAEHERLGQLQEAALDARRVQTLRGVLQAQGGVVDRLEPLEVTVGDEQGKPALVGWHLIAHTAAN
ncbi:MAG: methyltransferase domain-containing protein [Pseudomonadota bacterium]